MRISRFLIIVGIITSGALTCVWQNARQIELSYQLLHQEKQLAKLVDRNRILKYNILQLKSPQAIEHRLLASRIKLKYSRPIMIAQVNDNTALRITNYSKKSSFWEKARKALVGIFALRSQVEAKP